MHLLSQVKEFKKIENPGLIWWFYEDMRSLFHNHKQGTSILTVTSWPPEIQRSWPYSRRKERARDKSGLLLKSSYVSLTRWLWLQSHWPPPAEREVQKCNFGVWCMRVKLAVVTNKPLNVVVSHNRPSFFSHWRKIKLSLVASRPPTWGLRDPGSLHLGWHRPRGPESLHGCRVMCGRCFWANLEGPTSSVHALLARAQSHCHTSLEGWYLASSSVPVMRGKWVQGTASHRAECCPSTARTLLPGKTFRHSESCGMRDSLSCSFHSFSHRCSSCSSSLRLGLIPLGLCGDTSPCHVLHSPNSFSIL